MAYYYPTEYMCATLNSFIDKNDKIKLYMSVCKKKKINILPPDVNLSEKKFCVDGDSIRFGLRGIKQMGDISGQIIEERNTRGFFTGYQDFAERMSKYQKVSKKVLEGLIFSGAIDGFEGTRREKIEILPQILKVASTEKKNYESGQISLFDAMLSNEDNSLKDELEELKNIKMPKLGEYDKRYKLEKEKEFAGFYVTEHPLDDYTEIISEQGIYELGFLSHDSDENEEDDFEYSLDGEVVKVAGIIKEKKNIITKKGDLMSIFSIEDTTGEIRCVAFPKDFKKNEDKIYEGKIVVISGKVQDDERGLQLIVKTVIDIDTLLNDKPSKVWLKGATNKLICRRQWTQAKNIVEKNVGDTPVILRFDGQNFMMKSKVKVTIDVIYALQEIFGEECVKTTY